jgi:2-octaprenyl-6-methoxyphenol hydroxylase
MPEPEIDVAIRGAGPVGCALALALRDSHLSVRMIDRTPAGTPDLPPGAAAFRPLALSYGSRLILERIGAWNAMSTTPIEHIHVSQAGGFGRTRISREDLQLPALGYVADYAEVASRLAALVGKALPAPAEASDNRARLLVHAEGLPGGHSRGKQYGHTAIVGLLESERIAHGVAWERFTPEGPLALLPLKNNYGMVWSRSDASASALMRLEDEPFLAALQVAFGHRAGRFRAIGARTATPLALRYRSAKSVAGEVHIGNAAQTLHPVAGQGLNLGLRDAWELARLLKRTPREELGTLALAERFACGRRIDSQAAIRATDLMATLYVRRDPVSAAQRGAALTALDVFPPARRMFARRMIYGASTW